MHRLQWISVEKWIEERKVDMMSMLLPQLRSQMLSQRPLALKNRSQFSAQVIAEALVPYFQKLAGSGWELTRAELRRDVRHLLGGSYEDFMAR